MRSFSILLLLLLPLLTQAYSIPNHKKITQRAVDEYNSYASADNNPFTTVIDTEFINVLVRGNICEDLRPIRKGRNWHFYDAKKVLSKRKSLHHLFNELTTELDNMIKEKRSKRDIYKKLGHIIHFLQDINCPPHVVPVYHGGKDRFDGLDLDNCYRPARLTTEEFSSLTNGTILTPQQLLDTYSAKTLQAIKGTFPVLKNGKNEQLQWSYFWKDSGGKKANFGRYGDAGNLFGDITFKEGKGKNAVTYEIASYTYTDFIHERVRASHDITILAILYAQEKMKNN